jgi:hypothetical protein
MRHGIEAGGGEDLFAEIGFALLPLVEGFEFRELGVGIGIGREGVAGVLGRNLSG